MNMRFVSLVSAILTALFLADFFVGNKTLTLLQCFIPAFIYLAVEIIRLFIISALTVWIKKRS